MNKTPLPDKRPNPDPVFYAKNGWWFYQEDWVGYHGPYPTREVADAQLKRYAQSLERSDAKILKG